MNNWTTQNIPSQKSKTAIITGPSGLGFEDALQLANSGAKVILAGRNELKGQEALTQIRTQVKNADITFELLDLADLSSVKAFSDRIKSKYTSLDILINNAGLMNPPKRILTKDGFETQFQTNYIGHFALTGHLLPLLIKAKGRVISLSSIAARSGNINFNDLSAETKYTPMVSYSQSKLACLMFALELQKQSDANGWGITSIPTHPGLVRTDLFSQSGAGGSFFGRLRRYAWFIFQTPSMGALPTLFAATSPDAKPAEYYGPSGIGETRGHPAKAHIPKQALDAKASARLWEISKELSGTTYAQ